MQLFCMGSLENAILLYGGVSKIKFLYGGIENAICCIGVSKCSFCMRGLLLPFHL